MGRPRKKQGDMTTEEIVKKLFPPEQVTHVVQIVPEVCSGCQAPLPREQWRVCLRDKY